MTTSESKPHCPVCANSLGLERVLCAKCQSPHHEECFKHIQDDKRGCGIYACGSDAYLKIALGQDGAPTSVDRIELGDLENIVGEDPQLQAQVQPLSEPGDATDQYEPFINYFMGALREVGESEGGNIKKVELIARAAGRGLLTNSDEVEMYVGKVHFNYLRLSYEQQNTRKEMQPEIENRIRWRSESLTWFARLRESLEGTDKEESQKIRWAVEAEYRPAMDQIAEDYDQRLKELDQEYRVKIFQNIHMENPIYIENANSTPPLQLESKTTPEDKSNE